MADVVNLRTIRKRAKRREDDQRAAVNRLSYGNSRQQRSLAQAEQDKASRDLDHHRLGTGDDR